MQVFPSIFWKIISKFSFKNFQEISLESNQKFLQLSKFLNQIQKPPKVFQGGLKSMEINVQWKLWRFLPNLKLAFPFFLFLLTLHVKKDGVKKIGIFFLNSSPNFYHAIFTHLRKCILVQLGPRVNPNSGDSTLVYEMFSFRRNVHHTPFCCAVLPLILDVSRLSTKTAIYDYKWREEMNHSGHIMNCRVNFTGCKRWWPSVVVALNPFLRKKMLVGANDFCVLCVVLCVLFEERLPIFNAPY